MSPLVRAAAVLALMLAASVLSAQPADTGSVEQKLTARIDFEIKDQRLEEVLTLLAQRSGLVFEPMWARPGREGLDKDRPITLAAKQLSVLEAIERVLRLAQDDQIARVNTWQVAEGGMIQVGPRSRLNAFRVLKVYPIEDLLLQVRDKTNAPTFDIASGGSGGGGSGVQAGQGADTGKEAAANTPTRQERVEALIELITTTIEPEQWASGGGEGATIRFFQGSLLVNAPGYIHRQLGGSIAASP